MLVYGMSTIIKLLDAAIIPTFCVPTCDGDTRIK
jgi:hypothetical protein